MRNTTNRTSEQVRIGLVQWEVKLFASFESFCDKIDAQLQVMAYQKVDLVVFPEYFSLVLLNLFADKDEQLQLEGLAGLSNFLIAHFSDCAQKYSLNIVAGSWLRKEGDQLFNTSFFIHRSGEVESFNKIHLTPFEKSEWNLSGGDTLGVFFADIGTIGVQICYDVEFPELGRLYAEVGVDILCVPFSTDTQEGYFRVRNCAQARAIENECYVAMAGCVGFLAELSAVEFQYGKSAVFTPVDLMFPSAGIQQELDANVEGIVLADVNLTALKKLHQSGSVQNLKDRRPDFYGKFWS
ncbi:MAG: carbon-nitrogen hydrolase family protein [Bacteroidota bacterium]